MNRRLLLLALITGLMVSPPAESVVDVRLLVESGGIHEVLFADLEPVLGDLTSVPSSSIGLDARGESVPLWIDDGGDGRFGPGDRIEFVAKRVASPDMAFDDHTRYNVYWLRFDHPAPSPTASMNESTVPSSGHHQLERRQHLEEDHLMIRIGRNEVEEPAEVDLWYWSKLTQIDRQPFTTDIDLSDLHSEGEVSIRFGVYGKSTPRDLPDDMKDHAVRIQLGQRETVIANWDGRGPHIIELDSIPADELEGEQLSFSLSVPRRKMGESGHELIDVIMVNWIEVTAPSKGIVGSGQVTLHVNGDGPRSVALQRPSLPLVIYSDHGRRLTSNADGANPLVIEMEGSESSLTVAAETVLRVARIEPDRPSKLKTEDRQADYLMIAHHRLIDAVQPLADFHRQRGLKVAMVDVQDVYDEFNHGITHPDAIRDFVSWTYHHWQTPRPRFVLLVGDSSWDIKNSDIDDANYSNWTTRQLLSGPKFVRRTHPVYDRPSSLPHRNLVPTSIYFSNEGQSASDNYFVCVNDDDIKPDLAIGRFPVTEPDEVAAIVRKTISYQSAPEPGPWRRNLLWVANEYRSYQRSSDKLATKVAEQGFESKKIYPLSSETSNESHQAVLVDAFEGGQLLVHFVGHGGRHIWRTGPPDLKKNHDLFTLEHVKNLEPSNRLAFVLSMTCHSAPFDHPNADSIGEAFLRAPDRAAVGILAASWRNSPSPRFSDLLVKGLTSKGTTVGEAIQEAKRAVGIIPLIEMYNLLGDPALKLAVPTGGFELEAATTASGLQVQGRSTSGLTEGLVVVDLVDGDGAVVESRELSLEAGQFNATLTLPTNTDIVSVRAYAWDPNSSIDAMGWTAVAILEPVPTI